MKKNKIIAITGGIGSGKTALISILKEYGYYTVSCDEEIASLYSEKTVIDRIRALFPTSFVDGKIDKKIISDIVFNNEEELAKLNGILHPLVMERCLKKAEETNGKGVSFIEVPLLFECNLEGKFDNVIVVKRDYEERIKSVIKRSNLTREEIEKRIKRQIDYDKKDFSKYIVVKNNGDMIEHKEKIIAFLSKFI